MKSFPEKFFKWGILGIFLIIPLVYIPTWVSPYITPKLFFFMGAVDMIAIAWAWLMVVDARYRPSKKNLLLLLPALLFLVSLTISSIVGSDPATSFMSTVESGTGLVMLYHAFLFACMIMSVIRVGGLTFFKKIAQVAVVSGVILAVLTFFTEHLINIGSPMLNHSVRGAMMGNVLFLGTYLIFSLFLGGILIIWETSIKKKIWYGIGLLIILLSSTFFLPGHFSDSARMASISIIIGLAASFLVWLVLSQKKFIKVIGAGGLMVLVGVLGVGFYKMLTPTSSLGAIFTTESGNRLSDWHEAALGIKERPVLGWGQENYRLVVQKYLDPHVFDLGKGAEVWTMHPHNSSLEILVNGGVVGFIFYLGMIVSLFVGIIVAYRRKMLSAGTAALLTGMLVAYLIQNQMVFDTVVSYMMLFAVVGVVAGLCNQAVGNVSPQKDVTDVGWTIGISASSMLLVIFVIWTVLPAHKVARLFHFSHDTSEHRADAYGNLFTGAGSLLLRNNIPIYLDSFIPSYISQERTILGAPGLQEVAKKEINTLADVLDPVWQKRSFDYRLSLSLAQLKNLSFIFNAQVSPEGLVQAKKYEDAAVLLSPSDPQIYTTSAQTLILAGDKAGALRMVNKALELNPHYLFAQKMLEFLHEND